MIKGNTIIYNGLNYRKVRPKHEAVLDEETGDILIEEILDYEDGDIVRTSMAYKTKAEAEEDSKRSGDCNFYTSELLGNLEYK